MKKLAIVVLLLVLALVTAVTVHLVRTARPPGAMTVIESQAMDMSAMKAPEGVLPVSVDEVRREALSATVTYTGSVVAYGDEDVVARVSGRVLSIPRYPGDTVGPGELVAELDAVELRARTEAERAGAEKGQAEAAAALAEATAAQRSREATEAERKGAEIRIEQARAEVDSAVAEASFREQALTRDKELFLQGGLSAEDLQRSQAETEEARTSLRNSRLAVQEASQEARAAEKRAESEGATRGAALARVAASQAESRQAQAEAEAAVTVADYTRVTSLEGGVVTERLVSPGTLVMPGSVLLRIKRIDQLRLQARIPAEQAARMRVGSAVRVRPTGDRESFTARLTSIFQAADPVSRTVTVEAVVPNPKGRLMPGEYVEMTISLGLPEHKLTVPRSALRQDLEGGWFVFAVGSHSHGDPPVYTCPMHPEVRSDQPGECPKCGMDLVLAESQEERASTGGPAVEYTCVMHPEVRADRPGKCPKCGMDLVPTEARGDQVAEKVPVRPGPASGDRQAVDGDLKEGDEVIVQAPEGLREGMGVKAVAWGPEGPVELPSPVPRAPSAAEPEHQGHSADPHQGHGR